MSIVIFPDPVVAVALRGQCETELGVAPVLMTSLSARAVFVHTEQLLPRLGGDVRLRFVLEGREVSLQGQIKHVQRREHKGFRVAIHHIFDGADVVGDFLEARAEEHRKGPTEEQEKRVSVRIQTDLPVELTLRGNWEPGHMRDLSESGAYVLVQKAGTLQAGASLNLRMEVPIGAQLEQIQLGCLLVRLVNNPGGNGSLQGLGLQFQPGFRLPVSFVARIRPAMLDQFGNRTQEKKGLWRAEAS